MDLSWPKGASVNDDVLKDTNSGIPYSLHHPMMDNIMSSLRKLGTSACMYKIDISRAKNDPAGIELPGLKLNEQFFIDW